MRGHPLPPLPMDAKNPDLGFLYLQKILDFVLKLRTQCKNSWKLDKNLLTFSSTSVVEGGVNGIWLGQCLVPLHWEVLGQCWRIIIADIGIHASGNIGQVVPLPFQPDIVLPDIRVAIWIDTFNHNLFWISRSFNNIAWNVIKCWFKIQLY